MGLMKFCCSCFSTPRPKDQPPQNQPGQLRNDQVKNDELRNDQVENDELKNDEVENDELIKNDGFGDWSFKEFILSDLRMATKNFSSSEIISKKGEESSNVVYKGRLSDGFVAVKRFKNSDWPDHEEFAEDAKTVGEIKHKRLVNLLGYCYQEDERLIVAEFMANDTLAQRLFHQKNQTMEWSMRLRVAYCVAEALDYCNSAGFASYDNLSAYSVLFDKDGDACLSSFGLIKAINYDRSQRRRGIVNPKSVTYRFGTILVNLLTGKQISPNQAPEMINGKDVADLIDPNLKGNFSKEEATKVLKLASECFQCESRKSLITKELVAQLKTLPTKKAEGASSSKISPLGEACLRMDLNAIHEILMKTQHEDDKNFAEYTFQEWSPGMSDDDEKLGNLGDLAFEVKDFKFAIYCYSKIIEAREVVLPSVYARRSLSYLFRDRPKAALVDVMQAQKVFPDWPTGHYLHSVILAKAGMETESDDIFKQATRLEANNNIAPWLGEKIVDFVEFL